MKFAVRHCASASALAVALAFSQGAVAQDAVGNASADTQTVNDSYGSNEIIVTASKRSQSINDVPMSITAATGEQLFDRGINSTSDLSKIVPGLTAQPSPFNTPVYTLRGVGFYESSLAASPTVAVYMDEVPLPFSAMTKAAALDLERVEVLKGPQGTLFGNNTTGGAINYVAAKPTDVFSLGVNASYGRFNQVDLQGFISGPLTDTLKARVAVRVQRSDDWQYNFMRTDSLGAVRQYQGRLLLDWEPTDRLKVSFNVNGWLDKSDSQAPQRVDTYISVPGNPQEAVNRAYPYPPANARATDWDYAWFPGQHDLRHDDYFVQGAVRVDYELTDNITLTSISALERYDTDSYQDADGTALPIINTRTVGTIDTFSQELRLQGRAPGLNWTIGANYEYDDTYDRLYNLFSQSTTSTVGALHMDLTSNFTDQDIKTLAVFGNVEYEVLPALTVQVGARYTKSKRKFSGCTYDEPGGGVAAVFEFLQTIFRDPSLPFQPIPEGSCVTFDADITPVIQPCPPSAPMAQI